MSAPVQLFGLGLQGKSPNVTAQKRINLYAEIAYEQDKSRVAYFQLPGTTAFTSLGSRPIRGLHVPKVSDYMYAVESDGFYQIDATGAAVLKGTLSTIGGHVSMESDGTRILLVDGVTGYYYNMDTDVFTTTASANFPYGAKTVGFLSGRMVCEDPTVPGQFRWSDLYADTWSALNFAKAEASPDGLSGVWVQNGQLFLLGSVTVEPWGVTDDDELPFAPIRGAVSQWGVAAVQSVASFAGTFAFLGRTLEGQVQVVMMQGYQTVPISIPDLDYLINNYSTVEDAQAFSYKIGGHSMYEITFPTAGETWIYDGLSQCWSQVKTGSSRHLAELSCNYRNGIYVTDYRTGDILRLDPMSMTDNGEAIIRTIQGKHFAQGDGVSVSQLWIDVEMGVGTATGQGSDPQLMLQTSKDGGSTWSNELWHSIGPQGVRQRRAIWRRLGWAFDWVFRVSISDPVPLRLIGAYMEAQ